MVYLMNQIERFAWNSSDKLRGSMVSQEGHRIVLEAVFAKILLDAIEDKDNYILELLSINKDFDNPKLKYIDDENIVDRFISAVNDLIKENSNYLAGIFKDIFVLMDKELRYCSASILRDLSDIEFKTVIRSTEDLGSLFNRLVNLYLKTSISEHSTAPSINNLVAKLLEKESIKTVYDPTVGSGGLVIDVANQHKNSIIYGQEISEDALSICKMVFIINGKGININNLFLGDVLINPGNIEGNELKKFDCIVSAPPFGVAVRGYQQLSADRFNRFHRGLPSKSAGDYAFLSHIVESLEDTGVAIVLVANGIFFRGGLEAVIREQFIKENLIDCIIGLPGNMLYNTAIPTSLIVFRKNRKLENILFINVKKEEKISKVNTVLSEDEINSIADCYLNYEAIEGFSILVEQKQIADNDYNLNISRYISTFEREILDLEKVNNNVKILEKKLLSIQGEFNQYLD